MERRLEKIETKLAFLEDFIVRLQGEVVERNAGIDAIKAEHAAVKEKVLQISRELSATQFPEEIPNQKPPHY